MVSPSGESKVTLSWSQIRRFRIQVTVLVTIFLALIFTYVHTGGFRGDVADLIGDVCTNVIAALIIYLVIELVITKAGISSIKQLGDDIASQVVHGLAPAPGVVGVSFNMNHVSWSELFRSAKDVVIVARFFDGPMQLATDQTLITFFERGGRLRVLIADPANESQMAAIFEQRTGRSGIRHRPISNRIDASLNILVNALKNARADSSALKVYVYSQSINYSAYCFDEKTLLIAPVEHSISLGKARAPRVEIDLTVEPLALEFWRGEVQELFTDARFKPYDEVLGVVDSKDAPLAKPETRFQQLEEEHE